MHFQMLSLILMFPCNSRGEHSLDAARSQGPGEAAAEVAGVGWVSDIAFLMAQFPSSAEDCLGLLTKFMRRTVVFAQSLSRSLEIVFFCEVVFTFFSSYFS